MTTRDLQAAFQQRNVPTVLRIVADRWETANQHPDPKQRNRKQRDLRTVLMLTLAADMGDPHPTDDTGDLTRGRFLPPHWD